MTDRFARMQADLRLRNAAKAVVDADLDHLRADLSRKGLAARALDRVSGSAHDVYEEAVEVASDSKGALAAIVAALVLWFARNPILDALLGEDRHDDEGQRSDES